MVAKYPRLAVRHPVATPQYRPATRLERIIDALLAVRDLLIAGVAGALAGTTCYLFFAYLSRFQSWSSSALQTIAGEPEQLPNTGTQIHNLAQVVLQFGGIVAGVYIAVRVTLTVLKRFPLRGSPDRLVEPTRERKH